MSDCGGSSFGHLWIPASAGIIPVVEWYRRLPKKRSPATGRPWPGPPILSRWQAPPKPNTVTVRSWPTCASWVGDLAAGRAFGTLPHCRRSRRAAAADQRRYRFRSLPEVFTSLRCQGLPVGNAPAGVAAKSLDGPCAPNIADGTSRVARHLHFVPRVERPECPVSSTDRTVAVDQRCWAIRNFEPHVSAVARADYHEAVLQDGCCDPDGQRRAVYP